MKLNFTKYIIDKIVKYITAPFPTTRKPWLITFIPTIVIVVILLVVYHPLRLYKIDDIAFRITAFSLIPAVWISILLQVLPRIFKNFYVEKSWNRGRQFLIYIVSLTVISIAYYFFYNEVSLSPPDILYRRFIFWVAITFSAGMIPVLIINFIIRNEELKSNLAQFEKKYDNSTIQVSNSDDSKITLPGVSKDIADISPTNLLYVESFGNYVKINYLSDDTPQNIQIRYTISKMELDLQEYPYFVRCHRAFLVNILHVTEVSGNAQGLVLVLHEGKDKIPVSRTYIKAVREKLDNLR